MAVFLRDLIALISRQAGVGREWRGQEEGKLRKENAWDRKGGKKESERDRA